MDTLGSTTTSVFDRVPEANKIHLGFIVETGNTIYAGMPVKLTTTGTIEPLGNGEEDHLCIGVAIMGGVADELVTVATRGYCVVNGESATASLNAGPVDYSTYNTTTNLPEFDDDTITNATCIGWALADAAADGDAIKVLVRD